jgi:hypothetical protein
LGAGAPAHPARSSITPAWQIGERSSTDIEPPPAAYDICDCK